LVREQHRAQRVDDDRVVAGAFQLTETGPHRSDRVTVPGQAS
jgi:hypothetical protein